jgi:hypothetical protein
MSMVFDVLFELFVRIQTRDSSVVLVVGKYVLEVSQSGPPRLAPYQKRVHKKSHGKISFLALVKTMGQRWRELPQHQKKKYQYLVNIDSARYRIEIRATEERLRREDDTHFMNANATKGL